MSPDADRPEAGTSGRSQMRGDLAGAGGGSVARHRTGHDRQLAAIEAWLKRASVAELGALLAEITVYTDETAFYCTACQRTTSEQIQHAPAAYETSPTSWRCTRCGADRSRWALIGAVRSRPSARGRLLDLLADEGLRRG